MSSSINDWFKSAFDRDYTKIYAHRNDEAAVAEVDWLQKRWQLPRGARLLDLCCGNGRHAQAWMKYDICVVGLDYSPTLLKAAKARSMAHAYFVRGDMRRIPLVSPVDALTSFFTSFGYFAKDSDDRLVLAEMHRMVRGGGALLIDFLNADFIRQNLVPHSENRRGGWLYIQDRFITADGQRVVKTIAAYAPDGQVQHSRESVRLYDIKDWIRMFDDVGLDLVETFGSFDGQPFTDQSDRLILLTRRRTSPLDV